MQIWSVCAIILLFSLCDSNVCRGQVSILIPRYTYYASVGLGWAAYVLSLVFVKGSRSVYFYVLHNNLGLRNNNHTYDYLGTKIIDR